MEWIFHKKVPAPTCVFGAVNLPGITFSVAAQFVIILEMSCLAIVGWQLS